MRRISWPCTPLALVWLICATGPGAAAELLTYEAPEGAPHNSSCTVAVRERDGAWRNLFVYDAVVGPEGKDHMGFVYFDSDFTKPLELRITPSAGEAKEVRVRPRSRGIEPVRQGHDVILTLTKPVKLSVEFDGDIMHNLFVFANPKEQNPIKGPGKDIVYYGPGVHMVGGDGRGRIPIDSGTTVYLAGGAIVYGLVDTGGKHDVSIRGRGILCGTKLNHDPQKPRPQMVYVGNTQNLSLEGITILDAPCWNIHLHNVTDAVIRNVKIIAWIRESDGIDPRSCQNLVIDDCFIRNGDDCVSIKLGDAKDAKAVKQMNRNITVENCVLWPDRAHPLLIGPEGAHVDALQRVTEKVRFRNIDILRSAERNPEFFGALAIMAADRQVIREVLYEDIRVDPIENGNLIDIRFVNNVYTADFGERIENIVFRNITLQGPNREKNRILGYADQRQVDGVVFDNLVINGKTVRNAEAGNFEINQFVRRLSFTNALKP